MKHGIKTIVYFVYEKFPNTMKFKQWIISTLFEKEKCVFADRNTMKQKFVTFWEKLE